MSRGKIFNSLPSACQTLAHQQTNNLTHKTTRTFERTAQQITQARAVSARVRPSFSSDPRHVQKYLREARSFARSFNNDPDFEPFEFVSNRDHQTPPENHIKIKTLEEIRAINKPQPNTCYHFEGNQYHINSDGMPYKTTGTLRLGTGQRRHPNDSRIGKSSGVSGDIGFHLGADQFGFVGGPLNVVPGNTVLNGNMYAKMENKIADFVKDANKLHNIKIHATFCAFYNKKHSIIRPTHFTIHCHLAEGVKIWRKFKNDPTLGSKHANKTSKSPHRYNLRKKSRMGDS